MSSTKPGLLGRLVGRNADSGGEAGGDRTGDDEKPKGWFQRLRSGLSRSSDALTTGITSIFTQRKLDRETIEELEDILIQADLGLDTATRITDALAEGRFDKTISPEEVRAVLRDEIGKVLAPVALPLEIDADRRPHVILMVGVNGSGKTTTIGKLAARFRDEGRSVMLAAGDTFRAAAIDQLKVWGERVGARVVARDVGADASGLAFDALREARDAGSDVLLIDTAGRLQNKATLMAELEKVVRVLKKQDETAPHSVLLVLDATTGQNAINQVEIFGKTAGVTGLIMTKLDGTARGGILVAIASKFGLPVHAIGVGESVDDLRSFDADDFARAIAGIGEEAP
jgi:fused signal recognition particle receptor